LVGGEGYLFCTICGWDELDGKEATFNEIADQVIEENKEFLKEIGSERYKSPKKDETSQ